VLIWGRHLLAWALEQTPCPAEPSCWAIRRCMNQRQHQRLVRLLRLLDSLPGRAVGQWAFDLVCGVSGAGSSADGGQIARKACGDAVQS